MFGHSCVDWQGKPPVFEASPFGTSYKLHTKGAMLLEKHDFLGTECGNPHYCTGFRR